MKSFSSNPEEEVQYECVHLSRSTSPVRHITNNNLIPVYSPNDGAIGAGDNFQDGDYRSYVNHIRQTSLEKSKSRSLSRSSDYQYPGEEPGNMQMQQEGMDMPQGEIIQEGMPPQMVDEEVNDNYYDSGRVNRFNRSFTYEAH